MLCCSKSWAWFSSFCRKPLITKPHCVHLFTQGWSERSRSPVGQYSVCLSATACASSWGLEFYSDRHKTAGWCKGLREDTHNTKHSLVFEVTPSSVWKVVYFYVSTSFIHLDLADISGALLPASLPVSEEKHSFDWQVKLFKVNLLYSSPSQCRLLW